MTRSIKTLALVALLSAATTSTLFATGNRTTLNKSDWNAIAEQAEMESMLDIESIPAVDNYLLPEEWTKIENDAEFEPSLEMEELPAFAPVSQNNLDLNLKRGRKVAMILNAPFETNQQVGVAVIDANGTLVYAATGSFAELQNLHFTAAFVKDATYVVRVYSQSEVYETTLQVVNL